MFGMFKIQVWWLGCLPVWISCLAVSNLLIFNSSCKGLPMFCNPLDKLFLIYTQNICKYIACKTGYISQSCYFCASVSTSKLTCAANYVEKFWAMTVAKQTNRYMKFGIISIWNPTFSSLKILIMKCWNMDMVMHVLMEIFCVFSLGNTILFRKICDVFL